MVVYEVEVNGQVVETIKPEAQRLFDIFWFMVDRVEELHKTYGENYKLHRRVLV